MGGESRNHMNARIKFRSYDGMIIASKDIWKENKLYYFVVLLMLAGWFFTFQPMYVITVNNTDYLINFSAIELMELEGMKHAGVFVMFLFLVPIVISLLSVFLESEFNSLCLLPCVLVAIIVVAFLLYLVTHTADLIGAVNGLEFLPFEISKTRYLIALGATAELTIVFGLYANSDA